MVLVRIWRTFRFGFGPVLHGKVVCFWSYFGHSWSYLTNGSTEQGVNDGTKQSKLLLHITYFCNSTPNLVCLVIVWRVYG